MRFASLSNVWDIPSKETYKRTVVSKYLITCLFFFFQSNFADTELSQAHRQALIGHAVGKHDLVHILKFMWVGANVGSRALYCRPPIGV